MEAFDEEVVQDSSKCNPESRTSRFFSALDNLLGKSTRLLLWALECAGIIWVGISMTRFGEALDMIKAADTQMLIARADRYLNAVKVSAESTNSIVIAICAALPGAIGALRAFRKIQKQRDS